MLTIICISIGLLSYQARRESKLLVKIKPLRAALLKANSRGFTRLKHLVLQADIRVRIHGFCCIRQTEATCPSQSLLTRFAPAPVESVFPILSTGVKRVRAMSDTHTDSKPMV